MKITLIREERESGKEAVSTQETDMLMEKLKTENKTGYITELRSIIPHLKGTNARYEHIDRLPRLYPAVEMTRTKAGEHRIKTYNGLILLEVNNLAGVAEAELVKQQAALLPQTFAAFCGSSGRSAKIWVRFTLPDGGLPKNEDDIALFHAHAYRLAVKCYQPLLPFPITLQAPSLLQSCRMTVDEQPYYSPTAVAFCLEQPCALPSEDNYRQRKQQESNPLLRMTPGYEVADTCNLLFEAALDRAFRDLDNWRQGDDLRPLLSRLAEHCFKAGIPEEEVVRQTLMHYYREADEPLVRLTLHNLYGELKGFGTRSSLNKDQETAFRLEEFMKRRYDFRYNTQVGEVEYRERHSFRFRFSPIDKRTLNSIALDAQSEGIPLWDRDISRYIYSNRIPVFNPLEDYLYDLPHWDGKDRILALAQTVPCNNPYWAELFHRWFLNMVAHWRGNTDKKYANSVSPLLVGAQGTRKSTFCRSIVPPELRAYYTDSIDFSRKRDAELYLNRFALINIDEFDQISSTQQGFLKHILQKPVVNVRKPYANAVLEMRRYASFIATSNQKDLLTDPSGSCRFICIEVTEAIDTNRPIDYNQLYTQAMHELDHGERYWFDQSDERIMTENNHDFEQIPPEEQLFYHYFRVAGNDEEGEWLSSAEILNSLRRYSAIPLSTKRVNVFGRILQKHEVPSRRTRFGTLYHVVECKRQED